MSLPERVLDGLGPGITGQAGDLLEPLVVALVGPAVDVDALVSDTDAGAGWTLAFDLDRTPWPAWLGQLVGGRAMPGGLTLTDQRAFVRERPAWRRGRPAALVAAVRGALRGSRRVTLIERDGSPYRLRVQVYRSEVVTEAAVWVAARSQKPAGVLVTVDVLSGATVAHMRQLHGPTVADYAVVFPLVSDARNHVPEGA